MRLERQGSGRRGRKIMMGMISCAERSVIFHFQVVSPDRSIMWMMEPD